MATREVFLKTYANLPLGARNEIILVLTDYGPITWNVAHHEVREETEISNQILKKLDTLGILPVRHAKKTTTTERSE